MQIEKANTKYNENIEIPLSDDFAFLYGKYKPFDPDPKLITRNAARYRVQDFIK